MAPITPTEFDVIVIGSGSGSKITRPAAKLGNKVAIVEKVKQLIKNFHFKIYQYTMKIYYILNNNNIKNLKICFNNNINNFINYY